MRREKEYIVTIKCFSCHGLFIADKMVTEKQVVVYGMCPMCGCSGEHSVVKSEDKEKTG